MEGGRKTEERLCAERILSVHCSLLLVAQSNRTRQLNKKTASVWQGTRATFPHFVLKRVVWASSGPLQESLAVSLFAGIYAPGQFLKPLSKRSHGSGLSGQFVNWVKVKHIQFNLL